MSGTRVLVAGASIATEDRYRQSEPASRSVQDTTEPILNGSPQHCICQSSTQTTISTKRACPSAASIAKVRAAILRPLASLPGVERRQGDPHPTHAARPGPRGASNRRLRPQLVGA